MAIRIERLSSKIGILVLLVVGLLVPVSVAAQETIVPLQFSLSDPGARSMGIGGAFVALADDATAAFANPAGLVQLVRPEVSIELRHSSYSTPYTAGGRVEGLPSGVGADTTVGLRTASSEDELTGLSFLSVAYPKGRWSLAFFRHELANFEFFSESQALFGGGSNCCQTVVFGQRAMTDLEFVSYGLAAAYRVSENLDIGFGGTYHDAYLFSQATTFLPDEDPRLGLLAPTSFLPERSLVSQAIAIDDSDWTVSAGFLWRLSERWRIGGVYRQGPEVDISAERTAGEADGLGVAPGTVLARVDGLSVQFPRVLGLGFAYRAPDGGLTVSFQWDRIEYSSIIESLGSDDETVDDVDELHLGGEYVFLHSTPIIAVRLGTWLDPDHQIRATSDDPFFRAQLPRGEDQMHYTAGAGIAFKSFQADLGVDLADRVNTVSLSAVYSF